MQCLCMVVMLFVIDYLLCVGSGFVTMHGGDAFCYFDYLLCVGKGGVVVLLHFRFLCYTHMGLWYIVAILLTPPIFSMTE